MKWLRALFSRWVWLMAWRDTRASRRRLLLFSSSISLGIAALVAIGSLGRNLEQAIQQQSKALLGADLVITARQPFTDETEALITRLGGETARETSFSTMLVLSNGTRLVNARAVSGGFPFYGQLETEPASAAAEFRAGGGVLVEEGVLQQFDAKSGDIVKLGASSFRILGALRKVPGDGVAFATIAPRLYLTAADLPRTELLRGGSLARYKVHFRFPENTDVTALVKPLEPEFTRLRLDFDTVKKRQKDLGEALANLYRFLNLVALVALLLGAVGIASAIHVHVRQKLTNVAVLRCLGAPLADTFGIYLAQGLALGVAGALAGVALGALVAQQLPALVASFVPFAFTPHFAWGAALEAATAGFVICVLFALLPLLEVRRVSPLAAIRAAFDGGSAAGERRRGGLFRHSLVFRDPVRSSVIGLIALAVTAFAMAQTERPREGLAFAAGLSAAFALLAGAARIVVWLARRCTPPSLPFVWRQGLASLHRPQNRTTLLLLALGLGTFLILTLHLVRDTLLTQLFP
ncbi:MAG TPA: FtsX-like permease family protein, partial [Candidatus Limnocylindria bacterium]|nr:FtsX-like permease family protein [Candidatus Limnocylindria bacterium]